MDDAQIYRTERKAADASFRTGDGRAYVEHAARADAALLRFAKSRSVSTDDAAKLIRRRR